jgi:acetyl esterase/lipase
MSIPTLRLLHGYRLSAAPAAPVHRIPADRTDGVAGTVPTMPIGYVVTVTLMAWCVLFAVAPPRPRRSSPSNLSFRFGYLPNELPFVACYWLLASTLLAAGQGDLRSPGGWAAFGLAVLTTVGLVVIARRGLRAGPAVQRALAEGLGAGWRTSIDAGMAAGLRRRLRWARILCWPFPTRPREVERVANLRYGDAGRANLLDLYRHRSHPAGGPTLIYLHGGAFRGGAKSREARPLIHRLASRGWVCVSANYRLGRSARFPDHLVDVKKVIAWMRDHGHRYGADPEVVFLAGSSAGGHLAAMAALTANDPAFQPGFERRDTAVAAAICLYGYYGGLDTNERSPSSPRAYVRSDAPPFFVAHGDKDTIVLVEDARRFVEELRGSSSSPVVYAELPGAQHVFDLVHSLRFEAVVDAIEAFAGWVRSSGKAHRA